MKRRIIVIVTSLLVCGTLAVGWWWVRTSPDEAASFLSDRGVAPGRAQDIVSGLGGKPDMSDTQETQALVASGSIEGDELALASEYGGRIAALYVQEGVEVEAGQVLVELDTSLLEAQKAQAVAAVSVAEANLAYVKAGSHPAQILAAQAAVGQAEAERDAAETAWKDAQAMLDNPQAIDEQIVAAEGSVDVAAAQIEEAKAKLAAAQVQRDQYNAMGSAKEKGLYAVYDYQVAAAQAALDAAVTSKEGAEENLAALQALRDHPLAMISQVHMAESQYTLAVAAVAVAVGKLTELQAGPMPEQVAVAQAQVTRAKAAVAAVEAQIDKRTLHAPMSGVVATCPAHVGEAVVAGTSLLTIADLDDVRLVIYVPENQLGRVYLGQQVEVRVDSFPGEVFRGAVTHIAQEAEFTPKNVQTQEERVNMVFAVTVRLPNPGHLLKPGMPADAILGE